MSITIVTAFFDIGRGSWGGKKGDFAHLKRTTNTYFRRFSRMASLENEMIIFTSADLVSRVEKLRKGRPGKVVAIDLQAQFHDLRENISRVQNSQSFQSKINPNQVRNPEYWNADYVLVNILKSTYLRMAIEGGHVSNDLVAWLDFGYCRKRKELDDFIRWDHDFDHDKIHLFSIKEWPYHVENATPHSIVKEIPILDTIANNEVYVIGPSIVANQKNWIYLDRLYQSILSSLIENGWIDDDQSLFLMAYLVHPDKFEIHAVRDWFLVFEQFSSLSQRRAKSLGVVGNIKRMIAQYMA